MNRNSSSPIAIIVLLATLAFVPLQFHGLNWGTPSPQKTEQLFGSMDLLRQRTPELLASRQNLFEGYEKALAGQVSDPAQMRALINKSLSDLLKPGEVIPQNLLLGFMRGYLFGVPSDDQQTLSALSRFKPWKGEWKLDVLTYGGFYLGTAGVSVAAGMATGYLPRAMALADLLTNPDGVAHLYIWIRGLSALTNVATAILLFIFAASNLPWEFALLAPLFFLASPLTVVHSHLAKPHPLGTLFIVLAAQWMRTSRTDNKPNRLYASALAAGFATASILTNALGLAIIAVWGLITGSRLSDAVKALALGLAVFFLCNPFVLLYPMEFIHKMLYSNLGAFGQGHVHPAASREFVSDFLRYSVPWSALPLILLGSWKQRQFTLAAAVLAAGTLIVNILMLRHPGMALVTVALLTVCWAHGAAWLWQTRNILARIAVVVLIIWPVATMARPDIDLWQRYVRSGNLTEAGRWINDTLPAHSEIGIRDGDINPTCVPAFRMLDYALVVVPSEAEAWGKSRLPRYLITAPSENIRLPRKDIESFYMAIYDLPPVPAGPDLPYLPSGENVGVTIWKMRALGQSQ